MSAFTLYPAIDMRNGKCVRLVQGNYDDETIYGDSPLEMASFFAGQGAEWIHLVDLDGAKAGKRINDRHVLEIAKTLDANIQVGGGIRSEKDIDYYLTNDVNRVILGSSAVSNPSFVKEMLKKYGKHIAIGLDARNGFVSTEGWLEDSHVKACDLGRELAHAGAEVFIFTDIANDGMLSGPNVESTIELAEATGKEVIASGGVSSLEDLETLAKNRDKGIAGAIVGKALYTNRFSVEEGLEKVKSI